MIPREKRRALFEDQARWFDRMGNAPAEAASRRAANRLARSRKVERDIIRLPSTCVGRAKGGIARAAVLTPERRSEIARAAAAARWGAR